MPGSGLWNRNVMSNPAAKIAIINFGIAPGFCRARCTVQVRTQAFENSGSAEGMYGIIEYANWSVKVNDASLI